MKKTAMDLEDGQDRIWKAIELTVTRIGALSEKIEAIWQVVQRLQTNEETNRALVDRLIEMSMVQKGEVDAANIHRRTAGQGPSKREEPHPQEEDWLPSPLDEEWPPKGFEAAEVG